MRKLIIPIVAAGLLLSTGGIASAAVTTPAAAQVSPAAACLSYDIIYTLVFQTPLDRELAILAHPVGSTYEGGTVIALVTFIDLDPTPPLTVGYGLNIVVQYVTGGCSND